MSEELKPCPFCGERDAKIARLRDLLALIHRDGGQYLDTHGIDKACADAVAKVSAWREAQEELDRLREPPTADTPADSKPDFAQTQPVRYVCKP